MSYYDPECDAEIAGYAAPRMALMHVGMTECDPNGKNPWEYRFMPVNSELLGQAARYAWETLQTHKLLFVHEDTLFGQATANQFRRVLGFIRHDVIIGLDFITKPGSTDFSEALALVRKEGDDYITYTGTPAQAGQFIKQAREGGYAGVIQVITAYPSQETIDAAQGKAEGTLQFFGGLPDTMTEQGKQFQAAYAAHGFRDPSRDLRGLRLREHAGIDRCDRQVVRLAAFRARGAAARAGAQDDLRCATVREVWRRRRRREAGHLRRGRALQSDRRQVGAGDGQRQQEEAAALSLRRRPRAW